MKTRNETKQQSLDTHKSNIPTIAQCDKTIRQISIALLKRPKLRSIDTPHL